jgi:hypothetical protein
VCPSPLHRKPVLQDEQMPVNLYGIKLDSVIYHRPARSSGCPYANPSLTHLPALSPAVRFFFFFSGERYVSFGRSYAKDAGSVSVTTKTTAAFLPSSKTDLDIPTVALCGRHILFLKSQFSYQNARPYYRSLDMKFLCFHTFV